jgi:glutamate 5-kinase
MKMFLIAISIFTLFSVPVKAENASEREDVLYAIVTLSAYKTFCKAELVDEVYSNADLAQALFNFTEEEVTAMAKRASDKVEEIGTHKFCTNIKTAIGDSHLVIKHY